MYCRQRSTLRRLNFGPQDGEHLNAKSSESNTDIRFEQMRSWFEIAYGAGAIDLPCWAIIAFARDRGRRRAQRKS
jgi:hypothetical protein